MNNKFLTKSDFITAHDCNTKLYYKKNNYPASLDENEFLQYLAEGGCLIEKLSTLLYQDGIYADQNGNTKSAIKRTEELLQLDTVTLFEGTIISNGNLIRADIIEKFGNKINLIEVKSKSYESTDDSKKKKKIIKQLENEYYIHDLAYQYYVIKEKYPDFEIIPYLFLPDKSKRTSIEGLSFLFNVQHNFRNIQSNIQDISVSVDEDRIEDIRNEDLITLVDLSAHVLDLQDEIEQETKRFVSSLEKEIIKINSPLSKKCFKCEYNLTASDHPQSGFDECWRDMPNPQFHIRDIYKGGTIGGTKNPLFDSMINESKLSFSDIPLETLSNGPTGYRQRIQIKNTIENKEWFSSNLKSELESLEYPLHFIDFEAIQPAIPFHKGMRPYETVIFQWSLHTIPSQDSEPIHSEWLNLDLSFPNFKFAESLMEMVGYNGTPLMWSSYENTKLREIYYQMDLYNYHNDSLKKWLKYVVKFDKEDVGAFVDMDKITQHHYFHPLMKGKTSIKWVLPAVLSEDSSNRIIDWLSKFENDLSLLDRDENGKIIDPYKNLSQLDIYEEAESVSEGTCAMRAYYDLMHKQFNGDKSQIPNIDLALRRYCKLDTLAMVIIWEHWRNIIRIAYH